MMSRLSDGSWLRSSCRTFWAVYTLGYVAEIHLKIAFFRLCGLSESDDVRKFREMAHRWAEQLGLSRGPRNMHDLVFWTELLIREREFMNIPFTSGFASELMARVQAIAIHWREDMRYIPPVDASLEANEVHACVSWVTQHSASLWS